MFAKTKKPTTPGQSRSRSQIQARTRTLIGVANRAQTRSGKAQDMEDTGPTEVMLAQAIATAQHDLVKAILTGCRHDLAPDEVFRVVIEPVLADAVVREVAWGALRHALRCADELAAERATESNNG